MRNKFFLKKPFINILEKPKLNSNIASQILYGEKYKILSKNEKYFKIKNNHDGYIGYIKKIKKINNFHPTHKVRILKSQIYLGKNRRKSNIYLPFASKIEILKTKKNFVMYEENKWIKSIDIIPITKKNQDYRKIFKLFLNCKYKWGGKTFKGIDCSAMLQIFYYFNDKYFPRDTKDQVKVKKGILLKKNFRKGDVIFWKGHVAVCIDSINLIHAYGPEKKVIVMPIKKTIELITKTTGLKVKKIFSI